MTTNLIGEEEMVAEEAEAAMTYPSFTAKFLSQEEGS